MAEWKAVRPGVHELRLESVRAVVMHYSDHEHAWWLEAIEGGDSVENTTRFSRRTRGLSLEAAKRDAEQALRAMHSALSELCAPVPVLQWQRPQPYDGSFVARVGQWVLLARSDGWTIFLDSPTWRWRLLIASEMSGPVDPMVNFRAAHDTLRNKLGVVFRVEVGDGSVIAMEDASDSFVVGGAIGGSRKPSTRADGEQKRRDSFESSARADIAHIDALAALRAFGEAISAVALVQFVSDVPVLRWVADSEPGWSRAEVSGWEIEAWNGNWAMVHRSGLSKFSPRPNRASEQDNRRAVERELRSLGVVFRTDGA